MNKLYPFLFFVLFQLCGNGLLAQRGRIQGTVKDVDGVLAGASVKLNGTLTGQLSSEEGSFRIEANEGSYLLEVQLLGYEPVTMEVSVLSGELTETGEILLSPDSKTLSEVVVTGQFGSQSVRNSVYQVRTITLEQIRLRGATNLQAVLNTELGMRFSNDLTLGTTDVQLMGMAGQNVKILLDGVPMIDRGSTRESLGQIDVNLIERIEIVEGPMSVSYGSDALAGVINIITKKAGEKSTISVTGRVQEETAGSEYEPFSGAGSHNAFAGISWQKKGWQLSGNASRNFFGGWQGESQGRKMEWMPKEQYLLTAGLGYRAAKWNAWYRFNGTDETLKSLGNTYTNTQTGNLSATDQFYLTNRWFHQLQAEARAGDRTGLSLALSYTDYSRETQTTDYDLVRERRTINLAGSQDKSVFKTTFLRATAQHRFSSWISVQHGVEINLNSSTGERILGSPQIHEYAYFASSELKVGSRLQIRPGLRFLKNLVYQAPPVIPSVNTKLRLTNKLDMRLAYARGFRSPALRELYFTFFDASHSIRGNKNLKAEHSDSFNGFLTYQLADKPNLRVSSTLGGFFNQFSNLITIGTDPSEPSVSTYLNIDIYKTTGFTLNNTIFIGNLQGSLGFSHIGRYNRLSESLESPEFVFSQELNSNLRYTFQKSATSLSLYYKYTGKLPTYQALSYVDGVRATLAETAGFHMADFTVNQVFKRYYSLITGVRNLFGVTRLANSATSTGGAHSASGSVPMGYGRSFFLGFTMQLEK